MAAQVGQELTRDEAAARSQLVTVRSQAVTLDLTTGPQTFTTTSHIEFSAADGASTFVDFLGDRVLSIDLNGAALDPAEHFDGSRVQLPNLAADNTASIEAVGRYMNTGEGVHRFVDPADGETYLYTQFEVADSRRAFPVFEQPDLKTSFQFTITAPAQWQVVSNEPTPEPSVHDDDPACATWTFAPTATISSYLAAFAAGPYEVVRDEVSTRAGVIPLAVLCRRSLGEHLDADDIFDLTKRGFAFFEDMFDAQFPFTKYDQLFAPEYNMGAMENVGLVTIAEIYVFRSAVPQSLVERRALTVLHELAHMWFGDLVTMQWWDDLWLNESFAEWASTTAQAEATRWSTAWTTFSLAEKTSAYIADQLSSTHPVASDARNWSDVENNFDHITYAKGASVLKQLVAYVGREPFVAGLRAYFARYAWGNTTLTDLLHELEATSGRDLTRWSQVWLQTAGVGAMRLELETNDAIISSATINQTAPAEHPTLRPHRMGIGCYDLRDGVLGRTSYIELDVDGATTVVAELNGINRPDLILINDDDLAYTKIRLDEVSLQTVLANPAALQDSLPRALVTALLWDMTRDGELSAADFIDFMLAVSAIEHDSTAIKVALEQIGVGLGMYLAPERRDAVQSRVADGFGALMRRADPGSDAQLQYTRAFAKVATEPGDVARISALLDGSDPLEGLAIDTDMRWVLLTALSSCGAVDAQRIEQELRRDATATGAERAAGALAARPTPAAKQQAWATAFESDTLANQTLVAVASGFTQVHDRKLLIPFIDRFHDGVLAMWQTRTFAVASGLATRMYPLGIADRPLLDATTTWLRTNTDAPHGLRRIMNEHRDKVDRALRAQDRKTTTPSASCGMPLL